MRACLSRVTVVFLERVTLSRQRLLSGELTDRHYAALPETWLEARNNTGEIVRGEVVL